VLRVFRCLELIVATRSPIVPETLRDLILVQGMSIAMSLKAFVDFTMLAVSALSIDERLKL
jgi:hypothetical protein